MQVQSLGQENPLEEGMALILAFLLKDPMDRRRVVGYSPQCRTESDVTEGT